MPLIGLALCGLVGLSLGLLGGGGSILAVPIFVSLLGVPPSRAIPMSLVVVAVTSATGALAAGRSGLVRVRLALVFGSVSVAGALAGSQLTHRVSEATLARLFATVMLVVATTMLLDRRVPRAPHDGGAPSLALVLAAAGGVGLLTGFLGVGGGFVILPALLWAGRLPIRDGIATSLGVIALTSLAGVVGHLGQLRVDWVLTGEVSGLSVAGMLVGQRIGRRVSPAHLRRAFAVLVAVVGVVFLLRQG